MVPFQGDVDDQLAALLGIRISPLVAGGAGDRGV